MTCKLGNHKITCFRGRDPLENLMSIVKDRQGNEWYVEFMAHELEQLDDMCPVDAYDEKGKIQKKFIKSFLTFVRTVER